MTTFLIVLAVLAALVLLISYICFRMAFYASRKPENLADEFDIPESSIYGGFRDLLVAWMKAAKALPHEDITIRSFDGLELWGTYFEYAPGAPIEILFHGYRGHANREMSGAVRRCHSLGHSALIVDQRACGRSGGHVITFGVNESRDCLAWIDYVINRFGPDTRIILAGVSMGAGTVVMASGRGLPKNVIGILADCGYTSPADIIKKVIAVDMHLPANLAYPFVQLGAKLFGGFNIDELSPIEAVKTTKVPILFIHGEEDTFVPYEMSVRCHDANPAATRLHPIPGAGHGLAYPVDQEGYLKAAREFFSPLE